MAIITALQIKENIQLNNKSFWVNFFPVDLPVKEKCLYETWKHKYTSSKHACSLLNAQTQKPKQQKPKQIRNRPHTRITHTWRHPRETEKRKSQQKRIEWNRNSFYDYEVVSLFRVDLTYLLWNRIVSHVEIEPWNKSEQKRCEHNDKTETKTRPTNHQNYTILTLTHIIIFGLQIRNE